MPQSHDKASYFSPSLDLIDLELALPYDLYINSSKMASKDHFIRIYPKGNVLTKEDLKEFTKKYHQIYISERQRNKYFKSISKSKNVPAQEKVEVIKDAAVKYLDNIFSPDKEFSTEVLNETIEGCREAVESMIDVVHDHDISSLQSLIGKLSFHDFYTYDHSVNVSMYSIAIYRKYRPRASKDELSLIGLGGLMHDLGKIKIPTTIINNAGKLSDQEFALIKKHPGFGKEMLEENEIEANKEIDLGIISRIIEEHHENFDGTGYPHGRKGDQIHILARITAIADFFDAITTKRSYAETLSVEDAVNLMRKYSGTKLDPKLFDIFVSQLKNIKKKKSYLELTDEFDPSQPHEKLPVKKVEVLGKKQTFGFFPSRDSKEDPKK